MRPIFIAMRALRFLRRATLLAAMGFYGCSSDREPNPVSVQDPAPGLVVSVVTFGATGDDGSDDTKSIERAIASLPTTGGTVLVPEGVYHLSAIHANPSRAIDLSGRSHVIVRGEGADRTVLRMAAGSYQGSISTIWIQDANRLTVRDLTIDANRDEVFYADEQSHALSVVSSSEVTIDGVHFIDTGGDGVRLLGAPIPGAPWVDGILIEDSSFDNMWRNGISLQRSVRNVTIRRNIFTRVSDQSISSEPSGQGGPIALVLEENTIHHSTGNWAVALAGVSAQDRLQQVEFRGNRVFNGAVYFLQASGVAVSNNTIVGDERHPPLRLQDVQNAIISDNAFTDTNAGDEGALQIVNDGGNFSANVTVDGNEIEVGPETSGIYVRDAGGGITIRANEILGLNGSKGILIENVLVTGAVRTSFALDHNAIDNFRFGIQLSTLGDPFSTVVITGNDIDHDQLPPIKAIGISLVGFASTLDVRMDANVFGRGVTRILCIISRNEAC